ncbi:MAG: T9SS type A sorting domain-containing protein [Bacteroidota bacterium]|nr:T9SS type A sorting domain-containing protein [Bacteroidota bacterium]
MGTKFTIYFSVLFLVLGLQVQGQTLQSFSAPIIDNLPTRSTVFASHNQLNKSKQCGTDTVNYTYNKTTALNTVTLNLAPSGNAFAQWYPSPQNITIHGFEFYAWQTAMTSAVVTLTCRLYLSGIDSMPLGAALASVTVNVDSTFGGGMLTALRKKAVFATPITTSNANGYVLSIETSSNINVAVVSNSWTAATPNGRSEWLSSVRIGTTFIRSYNINIGGPIFNADFIMQPFVSYNLEANFTPSTSCMNVGNPITFTNTSSPVLFNRFYNTRAFFNIPQFSCLWNYGDSSGTFFAINGVRTYNHNVTYPVRLYDTLYGWMSGCADERTKEIFQTPDPTNAYNNSPICSGGTLQLQADSIPNASYIWSGPNGFTSNQRNPSITSAGVAAQGLYSVTTVIGSCSSTVATTYASVINSYSASGNGPLCVGQNLNLQATDISNATYAWSGPNGFTATTRTPSRSSVSKADSGTYQVSISAPGCGVLGPFTTLIVVNDIPTSPSVGNNGPLCVGQNLNLNASGPSNGAYNWTGPNNFGSTQQNPVRTSVVNSFSGNYSVTLTLNGCTSLPATTNVTVNSIPSAPTAGNNGPLCVGQTLSLTASLIANANYNWSGPNGFTASTQNPTRAGLSLIDAGTYSVIASVNGCPSVAANTVVAITTNTPTPSASSNGPLCPGQNLQLNVTSVSGASFNWTGPNNFSSTQANPFINNVNDSNAGIYSVTATTAACGTSSAATVNLVINTLPPAPSAGNNGPVCSGDSLLLSAATITGANYFWTGPNGFSSNLQNPSVSNMSKTKGGFYSVYVTVSGCGTSPTSQTEVLVRGIPNTPNAASNSPVCVGDTIQLISLSNGVGPNALYTWVGPNNFSSTDRNSKINSALASDAGLYSVHVTDSGCTSGNANLSVVVRNLPASPTASSNSPICAGANLNLNASSISGASYVWETADGSKLNGQNPSIVGATVSQTGSYAVKALVNGCYSIPATHNVLVNPLPNAPVASNSGPACVGNGLNLRASTLSGASYQWNGPNFSSNQQNPILSNITKSMEGTYTVVAIVNGCSGEEGKTDVVINEFPAAPSLSSLPATKACTGDSLRFFANPVKDGIFSWNGPVGFSSQEQNPILFINNVAQGGIYEASVSRFGCESPKSVLNITVYNKPNTSEINGINEVKSGESNNYSVNGLVGSSYNWIVNGGSISAGAGTASITVLWGSKGTGKITVTETSQNGCIGSDKTKDITIGAPIGLSGLNPNMQLSVFPNPASEKVTLKMEANFDLLSIQLFDLQGRLIETTFEKNQDEINFGISHLQAGSYLVLLKTNLGVASIKFNKL